MASVRNILDRHVYIKIYVVRTVHFGMKMYNNQRNAQVFNLFIYLLLPSELNHYRNCTPAVADGLKETPKHVRQK
jgi:hypothetical protein